MRNKIRDKILINVFSKVALDHHLTRTEVEKIYVEYFNTIKRIISSVEVKGKTEEEVDAAQSNFNLPGFGKLYMNKGAVKNINIRNTNNKTNKGE